MTGHLRGSLVALVTPMTRDGRVDSDAYSGLLEHHLEQGTHGLVIGGTTGESPTLTPDELEELVSVAVEIVKGAVPVIAGCGTNNTASSIALTRRVCKAGADACLVVTPYYNKPTQLGLQRHFEAIADAATAPVILYNVPSRTATDLLPATVQKLSRHPNIVAIKEATGQVARATEIIGLCDDEFKLFGGDDATALSLMAVGAVGVISVTANVAPNAMAAMCEAILSDNQERAAGIDRRLQPLHRALFIEANPIPVKYALRRLGLIKPTLRLPLTELAAEHEAAVDDALRKAGLEI